MNIETLKNFLTGPTIEPKPTDLEIALARIQADHKTAMVAVKLLTESVQSMAAGNLDMAVVHEERNKATIQRDADLLKTINTLKREVSSSESRHLAAFEIALRPLTRAIEALTSKVNNIDADIHDMRVAFDAEWEAQARIHNTKLNAIAERLDDMVSHLVLRNILSKDLMERREVAIPPKKDRRGGKQPGGGRRKGVKDRPAEVRYAEVSKKLQTSRAPKARAKYMATLRILRRKLGMAPLKGDAQ